MFSWLKNWRRKRKKQRKKENFNVKNEAIKKESVPESSKEACKTTDESKGKAVIALVTDFLQLKPSNYQHVGARERQEDAFAFSDLSDNKHVKDTGVLAVVADGMGGLAKGDKASQVAVNVFLREHSQKKRNEPFDKFLRSALQRSNAAVYDLAFTGGEDDELGTTLVAAVVHEGKMHWISVGDSRIYLYRNNQLKQLNREHIFANKLFNDVENGLISRKEAEKHPERTYLTSYLGMPKLFEVDWNEEPLILNAGDSVMLCTDGLTNTLTDEEITEIFNKAPNNIAEELINSALSKNKSFQDNITILVLSCGSVNNQSKKGDKNA